MKTDRNLLYGYLSLVISMAVAYYLLNKFGFESWAPLPYAFIGLASVGAIAFATIKYDASYKLPWFLLAGGLFALVLGDSYYNILYYIFEHENAFPSINDAFYLAVYALAYPGLILLVKKQLAGRRTDRLIHEMLILGVVLTSITWFYLIAPTGASELGTFAKVVAIYYPVGDIFLWTGAMWNFMLNPRVRSAQFLALGGTLVSANDIIYSISQLRGTFSLGAYIDFMWFAFFIVWTLSAVHGSMTKLTQPAELVALDKQLRRLGVVCLSLLVGPLVLVIELINNSTEHVVPILVFTAIGSAIAVARFMQIKKQQTGGAPKPAAPVA